MDIVAIDTIPGAEVEVEIAITIVIIVEQEVVEKQIEKGVPIGINYSNKLI